MYKLFLDDERFPPKDGDIWTVCRSAVQAIETIQKHGSPYFISFDHDLGDNNFDGMYFVKKFCEMDMFDRINIPTNFDFYVHSQNPVGKENIEMYLNSYLIYRNKDGR